MWRIGHGQGRIYKEGRVREPNPRYDHASSPYREAEEACFAFDFIRVLCGLLRSFMGTACSI